MHPSPKSPDFVYAAERFQQKLLQHELVCGQPIRESVLAKEFGVSRPAMREALCQAIGWGVVEYAPYRGYRIKDFTLKEMVDWSIYREAIEGTAVRLVTQLHDLAVLDHLETLVEAERLAFLQNDMDAAAAADGGFHETIVSCCGNHRLAASSSFSYPLSCFRAANRAMNDYFLSMSNSLRKVRREPSLAAEEQWRQSNEMTTVQHKDILEAIKCGDWQLSEAILRGHIRAQSRNYELLLLALGDPQLTVSQLKDTGKYLPMLEAADWHALNL